MEYGDCCDVWGGDGGGDALKVGCSYACDREGGGCLVLVGTRTTMGPGVDGDGGGRRRWGRRGGRRRRRRRRESESILIIWSELEPDLYWNWDGEKEKKDMR
jgi:hypothetical protein